MAKGYKAEGKVLKRLIRRTKEGWEIEADPRHADLVVKQLGLKDDKGIGTPEKPENVAKRAPDGTPRHLKVV